MTFEKAFLLHNIVTTISRLMFPWQGAVVQKKAKGMGKGLIEEEGTIRFC